MDDLEKIIGIARIIEEKYDEERIADTITQITLANTINEKMAQTLTRHLLDRLVYQPTPDLLRILELTIYESLLASKIFRIISNDDNYNEYTIVMTTNRHEHKIVLTFHYEFHRLDDDDDVESYDVNIQWIVDDKKEMKVNTVMKLIIFNKLLDELKRYVIYLLRKQI